MQGEHDEARVGRRRRAATLLSRRRSLGSFALLALALSACSQFDVRARQDPDIDWRPLGTYAWLPPSEAEPADQRVADRAIDRRIRTATERELQAKGYRPADSGPADFLLNYRLSTSPEDEVQPGRFAYGGVWGAWTGYSSMYDSYDAGTLYLAAVNPQTRRMIWVGAAHARILPHISYQKRAKRVDAAMEKILASFPKR